MNEKELKDQEDNFLVGSVKCRWKSPEGDCTAGTGNSACSKDSCPIMLEVVYAGRVKKEN